MKENGADVHILTSLYDIAWLLNIRGNDIDYVPVVLSYLVLNETECIWFLQEEVVDDTIRAYLKEIISRQDHTMIFTLMFRPFRRVPWF